MIESTHVGPGGRCHQRKVREVWCDNYNYPVDSPGAKCIDDAFDHRPATHWQKEFGPAHPDAAASGGNDCEH
jgi:hypothetical protein